MLMQETSVVEAGDVIGDSLNPQSCIRFFQLLLVFLECALLLLLLVNIPSQFHLCHDLPG